MNEEEFLSIVWRLEEILMQLDYFRGRIGQCEAKCESVDAEHHEGLCPTCCDWYAKVLAEEERLGEDREFHDVMDKLNKACDEDKSGRYRRILDQSREGKIIH